MNVWPLARQELALEQSAEPSESWTNALCSGPERRAVLSQHRDDRGTEAIGKEEVESRLRNADVNLV